MGDIFIRDVNNKNKTKTMKKIIKLTETDLKRIVKKVIKEEDFGSIRGYDSDYTEYGNAPEPIKSPQRSTAEQIFQLFDHKIGEWSISPNHRVTKETNQYLSEWKENAINQLKVIINDIELDDVAAYNELSGEELELPENGRTLAGGDETKGGLPKQRGSKHPAMKKKQN
jgi:hypothetical protein|tara:strand:- start:58 stop:567 length:510 start_codon:yes stop_codon:yes gene_type:complete